MQPSHAHEVVRIEAGMVIVDSRGVDQDTGRDQDPEHDQAEVEVSWRIALIVDTVSRRCLVRRQRGMD